MSEISAALRASYIVEASIDDEAGQLLVVARIVDAETDRKMWVADYRGSRDDVRAIAQRIAFDVEAIVKRDPRHKRAPRLAHRLAAADIVGLPGNRARVGTAKELHQRSDFGRIDDALDRHRCDLRDP